MPGYLYLQEDRPTLASELTRAQFIAAESAGRYNAFLDGSLVLIEDGDSQVVAWASTSVGRVTLTDDWRAVLRGVSLTGTLAGGETKVVGDGRIGNFFFNGLTFSKLYGVWSSVDDQIDDGFVWRIGDIDNLWNSFLVIDWSCDLTVNAANIEIKCELQKENGGSWIAEPGANGVLFQNKITIADNPIHLHGKCIVTAVPNRDYRLVWSHISGPTATITLLQTTVSLLAAKLG